ncbi:hypothetical protein LPJ64_003298 [Coemansia asiatica]|uniref:Uncharacterized protein n=1 Tax=Coemansia asiatica TaxID=1052880 RepID=A0A9W8CK54_9FUNG|nr:hypothetical protein LPJ64_003298 [Coemansia asiatica]
MTQQLQTAVAKLALSGDTLILRGPQRGNQPPPERTLGLSFIASPRLANAKKGQADEEFAYEAREFLRRRVAGKPVRFVVRFKTPAGREYGSVYVGKEEEDIAEVLVREGLAKLTDQTRARMKRSINDDEEAETVAILDDAEEYAKSGKRGMWSSRPDKRPRLLAFEGDAEKFVAENKGRELRATVEQVRDAGTLRVTLHLPSCHQTVNVQMAGIRAPSTSAENPEPFGEEARFQVEVKLLQQDVRVRLAAPSQIHGTFVGAIIHPAGNIAEWLVSAGYARIVDWSMPYVEGGATRLRELELGAKERRVKIWKNFKEQKQPLASAASAVVKDAKNFGATVVRVISGDTLVVRNNDTEKDIEIQLASVRQPRSSETDLSGYAEQAREAIRKLCIGRSVQVSIDYTRPAQDGFRERDCATVRFNGEDVGERLVRTGLCTVLRHRNDDPMRSSNYDALLIASLRAQETKAGVHSGKPKAASKLVNASENAARARSFISHMQRSGRVSCIVDHVLSGARLRLVVPKDNIRLTFVLSGIRCPRAPFNNEAGEPFGAEALALTTRAAMQRNAEFEAEGIDKSGGFIGTLWLSKDQSLTEELLEEGLASIHGPSADKSPYSARLYAAEERAQRHKKGMWAEKQQQGTEGDLQSADAAIPKALKVAKASEAAGAGAGAGSAGAQPKLAPQFEFLDVRVSEMGADPTSFYVQIAQKTKADELEKLMADLAIAPTNSATDAGFVPKAGQLVRARYTIGDEWHRARVRSVSAAKNECEVFYLDFGNSETLSLDRVRPLPAGFAQQPAFAQEARFAFLRLPSEGFAGDYTLDALEEVRRLVEGCDLVANVEAREPSGVMHLTLYDPKLGRPLFEKSVNAEIAAAGYAVADKQSVAARHNLQAAEKIDFIASQARARHLGMWEYGDVTADE